jgi:hypothetical protein
MTNYIVSIGTYPGFVIGARTYKGKGENVDHVIYLPFIDICISVIKENKEQE